MKLSLLSSLVLAFSTLRVTAMPSMVTQDARSEEHKNNELSVRAVEVGQAADAQNLGPWGAVVVGAAVAFPVGLAVNWVWDKYVSWRDAGFPSLVDPSLLLVDATNGEDIFKLMADFVNGFSQKIGPEYGILLIEKDAIIQNGLHGGYDWLPVAMQKDPAVPNDYRSFDLLYTNALGFVFANSGHTDGSGANFFQIAGAVSFTINAPNTPDQYSQFLFGKRD